MFLLQALEYKLHFRHTTHAMTFFLERQKTECDSIFKRERLQRGMSIHRDDWPTCSVIAAHRFNAGHAMTHNAHVHYIFISSII